MVLVRILHQPAITGLYIDGIIDDRVNANFDNMNTYDANGNLVELIRLEFSIVQLGQVLGLPRTLLHL